MYDDHNSIKLIHINQKTSQKSEFNHQLKSSTLLFKRKTLLKRSLAFSTDIFIISILKISLDLFYLFFVNGFLFFLSNETKSQLTMQSDFFLFLTLSLCFIGYFTMTNYLTNGRTIGKILFNLRSVTNPFLQNHRELNYELSFQNSLRRSLAYFLCYLSFGTFFALTFFSEDNRGLPDYYSQSSTIDEGYFQYLFEQKFYVTEFIEIEINALKKQVA